MNRKLTVKLLIDLGLTSSMLLAFACRLTGGTAHEWIGILMFALLIAHNALNWRWYKNLAGGWKRFWPNLNRAVTIALLVVTVVLLISGLLISREAFGFVRVDNGFGVRRVHVWAAFWFLPLMSIHVGFHWNMLMSVVHKMFRLSEGNYLRTVIVRLAAMAIMIGGIRACCERELTAKLLMRHSFDFWDGGLAAFFMTYLLMAGLYIGLTHYALKLFHYRRKNISPGLAADLKRPDGER